MATEPNATEEQTLEPIENEEIETQDEGSEEQSSEESSSDDEEITSIGFGDEDDDDLDTEQEGESSVIKKFRERDRENKRLLREREKRIAELEQSTAPAKIEVGPKPTLESCGYDEEEFEKQLDQWKDDSAKAEEQQEKEQAKSRQVQESYTRDLQAYEQRKVALNISDDTVASVASALTLEQQAVAIQAAKDPAALVVALSKSPSRLAELAKIDNPWKLAAEIARMEGSVKITTTKKAPAPNRAERGSASMSAASTDKELERLEKEAEKTGNRTAVIAYKKQLKAKEA